MKLNDCSLLWIRTYVEHVDPDPLLNLQDVLRAILFLRKFAEDAQVSYLIFDVVFPFADDFKF